MNYNNLAQRTNYIAGSSEFKNIPFLLTSVNIPGLNLSHPEVGGRNSARIKVSADTVLFNALSIELLIDEDFLIYQEIMKIINGNVSVKTGNFGDFYFDFFIEVQNNKSNKVMKLDFSNCRIESIGDIDLDSQDDSTEITLTLDLIYDYYVIEPTKRYTFLEGSVARVIPTGDESTRSAYIQNFSEGSLTADFQLWGDPVPSIVDGGVKTYNSGLVLNAVMIDVLKPFEFIFRVKQEMFRDDATQDYLDFGITIGEGIPSAVNGRTGATLFGVHIDGGAKKETYSVTTNTDILADADSNFHEYVFTYMPDTVSGFAEYTIKKDGTIKTNKSAVITVYDFVYAYIQGDSVNTEQSVDNLTGKFN